jgi:hypothetical protein
MLTGTPSTQVQSRCRGQIETAQEVLVGLAVATVLGDDHAGHEFQHSPGAQRRTVGNQVGSDCALLAASVVPMALS